MRCIAFESGLHSTVLSQFENAATKASRAILFPLEGGLHESPEASAHSIPKIQISVKSGLNMLQFRELTADTMNKLIRIPGIVISASVLSSRATKLHLQCRACRTPKDIYPAGGLGGLGGGAERGLPRTCDAPETEGQKKDCPMDPYLIVHSESTFSDHQTLKLQEAPDMVPVGELPRHIILSADRYNAAQVVPGSRVIATGIYSTFNSSKNVRSPPTSAVWVDQTCHRNLLVYLLYALLIFGLCILNCLRHLPQGQVVQTLSVFSLPPKKRKNLTRWPGAKDSMNVLQRVLLRAFLEAWVYFLCEFLILYARLTSHQISKGLFPAFSLADQRRCYRMVCA